MKNTIFVIMAILLAFPLHSQDSENSNDEVRTIFSSDRGNGGYGALSLGYTQIEGRNAIMTGGRGVWLAGKSLGIGIGGFGFINEPEFDATERLYYNLSGGYGGFIIEPVIMGKWPVHLSFPVLLGAGAMARTSFSEELFLGTEPYEAYFEEARLFMVAEPGAELEFNLLKWMRLAFYGNYRFTTNINMIDVRQDALTGWSAGMTLKIGAF